MCHAFHVQVIQRDEEPERRHTSDVPAIMVADAVTHVDALQPGLHVATGFVGTALVGRADLAQRFPDGQRFTTRHDIPAPGSSSPSRWRSGAGCTRPPGLMRAPIGSSLFAGGRPGTRDGGLITAMFEQRLDGTVIQQVRIAADRRGEVGIGVIGQAEVPLVVWGVDGLLHGAQHHGLQQRGVRAAMDALRKNLVVLRPGSAFFLRFLGRIAQRQAGTRQKFTQFGQPVGTGALVHPVQSRVFVAHQKIGCAGIGSQHAFLDQPVGIVAALGDDFGDAALGIAEHFRFGGVEFDGPPLLPRSFQRLIERIQLVQAGQQRAAAFDGGHVVPTQNAPDLVVGQPGCRMHDGRIELVGNDLAGRIDHHVGHQHQPVDLGVDRAQAIGEFFRQHRNDATRKIHRGGAGLRFGIQRAAGAHIVADIGNGHQQAPALRPAAGIGNGLAVDGIVEVAGVLAIDGDQCHIAQIHAVAVVGRAQRVGQRVGLGQHVIGKAVRHVELAHGDLDFHAGIVHAAQHFGDTGDGRLVPARWFDDDGRHHLSRLCPARTTGLDEDVVLDALVFGSEHQHAALTDQPAHHGARVAQCDLDDLAFGPAPAVGADAAHQYPVAVHDLGHLARRQKDVGAAVIRQHEAETIPVAGHPAGNQVDAADQHQGALAPGENLPVALHGGHTTPHAHQCLIGHLQALDQLFDAERRPLLGQRIQNGLSAGRIDCLLHV